jgi:isopentenyl-diphosphate delta-isomerase
MSGTRKYLQIVDENDTLIGHKTDGEFDPTSDIYRVSALWLRNSKGEVLLAQRAHSKRNGGGLWGPAVAGTIENNESYKDNIVKEMNEEIGLHDIALTEGKKRLVHASGRRYFCVYFYGFCNLPEESFVLEDEVAAVKWVGEDWLTKDITQNPTNYVEGLAINLDGIMNDCRE